MSFERRRWNKLNPLGRHGVQQLGDTLMLFKPIIGSLCNVFISIPSLS